MSQREAEGRAWEKVVLRCSGNASEDIELSLSVASPPPREDRIGPDAVGRVGPVDGESIGRGRDLVKELVDRGGICGRGNVERYPRAMICATGLSGYPQVRGSR